MSDTSTTPDPDVTTTPAPTTTPPPVTTTAPPGPVQTTTPATGGEVQPVDVSGDVSAAEAAVGTVLNDFEQNGVAYVLYQDPTTNKVMSLPRADYDAMVEAQNPPPVTATNEPTLAVVVNGTTYNVVVGSDGTPTLQAS